MSLFPHLAYSAFNNLFVERQAGETIQSVIKQLFEWPIDFSFVYLIASSICVVSATIHLTLLVMDRIRLARRHGLIRNVSALAVFVMICIELQQWNNNYWNIN